MDLDIYTPTTPVHAIRCTYCHARVGEKCMISGDPDRPRAPHAARWETANYLRRWRQMWFVLLKDDWGLRAGDILRCVSYPYDAKVTVLFREWDGYNPECNQYTRDVAFLGWVPTEMETK